MGKKILVVDDEPEVTRMLKTRLEAAGYEVMTASTGEECLQEAKKGRPDLVILDILMPGIDGTEAAAQLKRNPLTRDIPIFFLTCLKTKQDERRGRKAGEYTIFAKPFDPKELLSKIKETVGEGQ